MGYLNTLLKNTSITGNIFDHRKQNTMNRLPSVDYGGKHYTYDSGTNQYKTLKNEVLTGDVRDAALNGYKNVNLYKANKAHYGNVNHYLWNSAGFSDDDMKHALELGYYDVNSYRKYLLAQSSKVENNKLPKNETGVTVGKQPNYNGFDRNDTPNFQTWFNQNVATLAANNKLAEDKKYGRLTLGAWNNLTDLLKADWFKYKSNGFKASNSTTNPTLEDYRKSHGYVDTSNMALTVNVLGLKTNYFNNAGFGSNEGGLNLSIGNRDTNFNNRQLLHNNGYSRHDAKLLANKASAYGAMDSSAKYWVDNNGNIDDARVFADLRALGLNRHQAHLKLADPEYRKLIILAYTTQTGIGYNDLNKWGLLTLTNQAYTDALNKNDAVDASYNKLYGTSNNTTTNNTTFGKYQMPTLQTPSMNFNLLGFDQANTQTSTPLLLTPQINFNNLPLLNSLTFGKQPNTTTFSGPNGAMTMPAGLATLDLNNTILNSLDFLLNMLKKMPFLHKNGGIIKAQEGKALLKTVERLNKSVDKIISSTHKKHFFGDVRGKHVLDIKSKISELDLKLDEKDARKMAEKRVRNSLVYRDLKRKLLKDPKYSNEAELNKALLSFTNDLLSKKNKFGFRSLTPLQKDTYNIAKTKLLSRLEEAEKAKKAARWKWGAGLGVGLGIGGYNLFNDSDEEVASQNPQDNTQDNTLNNTLDTLLNNNLYSNLSLDNSLKYYLNADGTVYDMSGNLLKDYDDFGNYNNIWDYNAYNNIGTTDRNTVKLLQSAMGITADGLWGIETLNAFNQIKPYLTND